VLRSESGRGAYIAAVERALAYIRAGDIYQANVAHRLVGRFSGSGAELFGRLSAAASPRHGMYFESAPLAEGARMGLVSLSPELFLSFDAGTRRLVTRPMKGTRPGSGDPAELRDAEKDRAELAMIVDLMRNDLGRVCEFGSVRVERAREIERHASGAGGVLQATATVSGVVREGLGAAEILRATFPPGSVTGTPKIRAMQVIEELEPFARGPYCGCLGKFEDDGSFELAVAIRTAVIRGRVDEGTGAFVDAELSYCVGAGIVADSDPEAEWEETLAKAGVVGGEFEVRA
jgi:para-aminobenzoate synthetase component 1